MSSILDPPGTTARSPRSQREVTSSKSEKPEPPAPHWSHHLVMGIAVFVPLVGTLSAIAVLWQFGWMNLTQLSILLAGYVLTGMGITIGFHRLLSHRAFEAKPWVRFFWVSAGSMAIEGSPVVWTAVHRKHHARSDKDGDPHSPHLHGDDWRGVLRGFLHAHTGWLFTHAWTHPELERYVPDLVDDRMLMRIHRTYYVYVILSLAIPAAVAGLITMSWAGAGLGLLWGGLVRIFLTHHVTWSINSICHVFGKQEYESGDDSRNNFLFGILGHGEGWHNNHHAFPASARHGLRWWQFDSSWLVIRFMERMGWVWSVHLPSDRAMERKRLADE